MEWFIPKFLQLMVPGCKIVDDFSEDLGAETVRLSSATVGFVVGKRFVGGLSAEMVGALLPSPPLCRWVCGCMGCRGHGAWLLCGSLWIAYLGLKISGDAWVS